jgi:hypothetical protein
MVFSVGLGSLYGGFSGVTPWPVEDTIPCLQHVPNKMNIEAVSAMHPSLIEDKERLAR